MILIQSRKPNHFPTDGTNRLQIISDPSELLAVRCISKAVYDGPPTGVFKGSTYLLP